MKSLVSTIVLIIFWCVVILFLYFIYTRGFIPHDEGWILNPAQRILQGDIPYKDFHYIYTPGVAYIIALGFKLFGVSIFTSRIETLFFALTSIFFIFLISRHISPHKYSYVLPALLYIAWGPLHINFAWPIVYAIWSGLLTCIFFVEFAKTKNTIYLFLAGVTTGLTLLFKQNFGVALIFNNILFFFLLRNEIKKKSIFFHAAGVLLFPFFLILYLWKTSAFLPFLFDMYYFMVQQIFLKGLQATPFIYPDVWYKEILKTLFYLSPLIVSIAAAVIAMRKNKRIVFLATFCGFYYLLGIRPTTDYTHLVFLLALMGIPILILLKYVNKQIVKMCILGYALTMILFGIYSGLYMNYYRWDPPLIDQHYEVNNPHVGILVSKQYQTVLQNTMQYVRQHTLSRDYIFIYAFSPSLYLVTDRKNPTKYIFLPPSLLLNSVQEEVIQSLRENKVKVIIADVDITHDQELLPSFIRQHYTHVKQIGGDTLWQIKL